MNNTNYSTSMISQFIELAGLGLDLLNIESQTEIQKYITDNQAPDGLFTDRAGTPDVYYSVFGCWLSSALGMDEPLEKLKQNLLKDKREKNGDEINRMALILIRIMLLNENPKTKTLLKLLVKRDNSIQASYLLFLFFLILDAQNKKNKVLLFIVRLVISFYHIPVNSSCSILSALILLKFKSGNRTRKLQQQLLKYYDENQGFKAFINTKTADLLSTSVALFALYMTGYDLRIITAQCLSFIQQNYRQGAFVPGTGDNAGDIEYTFYALLALGILSKSQGKTLLKEKS